MSQVSTKPSVLLVIPCYHESERLPIFLGDLLKELGQDEDLKILVVDDGSGHEEQELLKTRIDALLSSSSPIKAKVEVKLNTTNGGKGKAIYSGWDLGNPFDLLMFADADGATSAKEVNRMLQYARNLENLQTAVFGSRVKILGRQVDRLWKRHLIGRIYATLVSETFEIPIYDSQCGCKIVPKSAYEHIRDYLTVPGFAFDVDLLLALVRHGYKVVEFPVDWTEIPGGKVHLLKDSFRMLKDIFNLKRKWN